MKIDIDNNFDLYHNIYYVCKGKNKIVDMFISYIDTIDEKHDAMIRKYIKDQYYAIKYLGKKRVYITKNTILLSQKIKKELDISCYPMIETIGNKDNIHLGGWSWSMLEIEGSRSIGSCEHVSTCLRKTNKFDEIHNDGTIFIMVTVV